MISLDLEVIFSLALLEKSECHFVFTFHFSIVQNPLSQDTAIVIIIFMEFLIITVFDGHPKVNQEDESYIEITLPLPFTFM